ncbi:MAG: zinc-dependent alcohol dehydrogenase family protein [Methylococcales bacterium]|nr:zinc-dependent alcohol dehydrogenase family protein [Methylococcales bacterium]
MRAVLMPEPGPADVLQLADVAEPEITLPTQIKVRIEAAGVNPIDTKVRQQALFYAVTEPVILGLDGAGVVVAVGAHVSKFKVGDAVWFCHGGLGREPGSYAEFCVLDQDNADHKPCNLSFPQAAALPLVLLTAWGALYDRGSLQAGHTALIHAGAGGVGHIAIQLAKYKGARVLTTVSSLDKAELARQLGADQVIDYRREPVTERVMALTNHQGADLVLDSVGGAVFANSIYQAAPFGTVVTLLKPESFDLAEARLRNLRIGFEWMLTPMLRDLPAARAHQIHILEQCRALLEQEVLTVHVNQILPLAQAGQAHRHIEAGHSQGKVVLTLR